MFIDEIEPCDYKLITNVSGHPANIRIPAVHYVHAQFFVGNNIRQHFQLLCVYDTREA